MRARCRTQHAQRGRRDEGVAHLHLRHQSERLLRIEFLEFVRDDRYAVVQSRQQHVEQPAGPGPVRRRPEPVTRLRQKFVGKFDARQMAEQHAMGVQRALGRAGGTGSINHQRAIVGAGQCRREFGARAGKRGMKILGAGRAPVERQYEVDAIARRVGLAEFSQALSVGDQRARAGIFEPISDGLNPEQHGERQRDRAKLVDSDVAQCDRRTLRQQDGDPIAARDPAGGEHIGEPIRRVAQRTVADLVDAAVRMHVKNRGAARLALRPAVADVDADIVLRRHMPAERAVERVVFARGGEHVRGIHRAGS